MTIDIINKSAEFDAWRSAILNRDSGQCINCSRTLNIGVCFIVPPEVGGTMKPSNGVVICRDCRLAAEGSRVMPMKISMKTSMNFLLSQALFDRVTEYVESSSYGNVSSLIRQMMRQFVSSPELFEDLENWQDDGSDVKVNGWVSGIEYDKFKHLCNDRNISYTDALKALLMMAVDVKSNQEAE